MANEIYKKDDFAMEIIATGSVLDDDPGYKGDVYEITTWTFRLNHVAMNDWIFSAPVYWDSELFDCPEECEQKKRSHEAARKKLTDKIREQLGVDGETGFTVTKNVSEIFTATLIRKVENAPQPAKKMIAEVLHTNLSTLNAMLCCMI